MYIGNMKKLGIVGICGIAAFSLSMVLTSCGDDSSSGPSETPAQSSSAIADKPLSSSVEAKSSSSAEGVSSSSAEKPKEEPATSSSEKKAESSSGQNSSAAPTSSEKVPESSAAPESSDAPASSAAPVSSSAPAKDDGDDGVCENCDSFTAADPTLTENGGYGSVTTYGSVTAKETSLGGACNYGQTNIQYYAAIHVNVSPGDDLGPWQGGSACGGCVHVRARTPEGWKEVTVRITDRCPDANCGVDLGGAPASDIMGNRVGRYSGEWEFVSCEGVEGVWGDSTSVWVKEGSSTFWSIIQVRNPKDAVKSMTLKGVQSNDMHVLEMVVGTENFWTVPPEVLQTDNEYTLTVTYRSGEPDTWLLKGSELSVGEANLYLYEHRAK